MKTDFYPGLVEGQPSAVGPAVTHGWHGDPSVTQAAFSPDEQFKAEATRTLGQFRQAVEGIVYSVAGVLQNSRSLQAAIGVDLNVSWQVFRLLGSIETLATAPHVPAAVSFRKLIAAARKRGVAEDRLAEAVAAFASVEGLVERTAGSRELFETAVMSFVDPAESAAVGLHHRKASFKANVHFFGTAVDVLAFALIVWPGRVPGTHDFVGVRQMLGLRRLRANTDVLVDRWRDGSAGDPVGDPLRDALDPVAAAAHGAAVLPDFCVDPLPPLVTTADPSGNVRTLLRHRDFSVGRPIDLATGRVFRSVPFDRMADGRPAFQTLLEIARPTRLQVVDVLANRRAWPDLTPQSGVYAYLDERSPETAERSGVRLSFAEELARQPRGVEDVRLPEAPLHAELVRHVCRRMGWRADDLDLFRIRIEYPLMNSNIVCRLVTAPTAANG